MMKIALSLVVTLALPSVALAGSELFAERAKVIASGDTIQIFGLPSIDAQGTIKYFDTTIDLKHGDNGKPKKQASVTAVQSPGVTPTDFVVGEYGDESVSCTLGTAPFGGQTEVVLNCTDDDLNTAEVVVYTGPVASNPFAATLLDKGVDQLPGTEQFAWGLVTESIDDFGGCLVPGHVLSARQLGSVLVLVDYNKSPFGPNCSLNLFRIAP